VQHIGIASRILRHPGLSENRASPANQIGTRMNQAVAHGLRRDLSSVLIAALAVVPVHGREIRGCGSSDSTPGLSFAQKPKSRGVRDSVTWHCQADSIRRERTASG
jgi:hypothetical protein